VDIKLLVKGLKETQQNFERIIKDLSGNPILEAMGKAVLLVEGKAKRNAPVDRGALRASITPDVAQMGNVVRGVVGSNLAYSPYIELGTRPFWPPWKPLFEWARRKVRGNIKAAGALAYAARRSIAQKGIKARRYLQTAFEDSIPTIKRLFEQTVNRIIK